MTRLVFYCSYCDANASSYRCERCGNRTIPYQAEDVAAPVRKEPTP